LKYNKLKHLEDDKFKRIIGVKHSTFNKMIEILVEEKSRERRGRKSKLSIEDKLLLALE